MVTIDKKIKVLSQIGELLNTNNITWAVGGSTLLFLKKITQEFQDLDIMVCEEDIEKAKKLLETKGNLHYPVPTYKYKTKHFIELNILGVDIDVISGFTIVNNSVDYYFPLNKTDITDYCLVNNISIPLQSIKAWRTYYELMGRTTKVSLIDHFNERTKQTFI